MFGILIRSGWSIAAHIKLSAGYQHHAATVLVPSDATRKYRQGKACRCFHAGMNGIQWENRSDPGGVPEQLEDQPEKGKEFYGQKQQFLLLKMLGYCSLTHLIKLIVTINQMIVT